MIAWSVSPPPVNIPAAGGRHRQLALLKYIEEVEAEIKEIQEKMEAIVNDDEADDEADRQFNRESLQEKLKSAVALRSSLGPWLASVYNGSKHVYLYTLI